MTEEELLAQAERHRARLERRRRRRERRELRRLEEERLSGLPVYSKEKKEGEVVLQMAETEEDAEGNGDGEEDDSSDEEEGGLRRPTTTPTREHSLRGIAEER